MPLVAGAGFTWMASGEDTAADLLQRLEAIQTRFHETRAAGPHLVSIILDGENAWEYHDNDGMAFLIALCRGLSRSATMPTGSPSEHLSLFPNTKTLSGPLFPGAWFSADYDTWIGEEEETLAWEQLRQAREALAAFERGDKATTPEKLAQARDLIYMAEGSDWLWWHGSDQSSGNDEHFDEGFRALLRRRQPQSLPAAPARRRAGRSVPSLPPWSRVCPRIVVGTLAQCAGAVPPRGSPRLP